MNDYKVYENKEDVYEKNLAHFEMVFSDYYKKYKDYKKFFEFTIIFCLILVITVAVLAIIASSKPKQIPYLIYLNKDDFEMLKLGTQSNYKDFQNKEVTITVIKTALKNFRSVPTDERIVKEQIQNLNTFFIGNAAKLVNSILQSDKIYDNIGSMYRTIEIESALYVNNNIYQLDWTEKTYSGSFDVFYLQKEEKMRALFTIEYTNPTTENPLGIYIKDIEYTILKKGD